MNELLDSKHPPITTRIGIERKSAVVGMGQIAIAGAPALLTSILGSCVGVTLWHPGVRKAAMAHIVLADSSGPATVPGKYANTAIPQMLKLLREQSVPLSGLEAKIVGGASMFFMSGPIQIGEQNIAGVTKALNAAGVRPHANHLGGNKGRRVTLDCETGLLTVEMAGSHPVVI